VPGLPRPLSLAYALAIVVLMGEHDDVRHARAAARWAARLALERESVTHPHLGAAVRALALLGEDPAGARRALLDVARQHNLRGVERLLAGPPGAGRP
jgi:hypothetical protein